MTGGFFYGLRMNIDAITIQQHLLKVDYCAVCVWLLNLVKNSYVRNLIFSKLCLPLRNIQ